MAPGPFKKLLKLPLADRNRSHSDVLEQLDTHDSGPAAAESASSVARNLTGNPVPAVVEATAVASSSSGPAYHLDPEMARKYMKNIKRFRILVMGRANAGKTTLLQRVCNTVDNPEIFDGKGNKIDGTVVRGTLERGHHNIEDELVFRSNPGFVFHDSCGFEAGSVKEFNEMKSFVVGRAVTGSLRNRIHAIWYCIPMADYQRTVTAAEQKFFEECDTGHVPVIVILTKTDTLNLLAIEELQDEGELGVEITEEKAAEREKELLQKVSTYIKGILTKSKFPPKQYVAVQKMNEQSADCSALMHCTTDALDEDGLQRVLVSTQQSSIALCVEYAVKKTLKSNMELGIKERLMVKVKDIERDLLDWFPNKM
ncbi:hypothetical protein EDC04DRAFT_3088128 [Pisolithus marmoratus]|nr:hypothetical protein EDC04DRAFT_3088128 [Pisolithus marmoratus]